MFSVLGLGLEHSCPWPREVLSSKRLSFASDFFCVLGLEPCVLDFTPDNLKAACFKNNTKCHFEVLHVTSLCRLRTVDRSGIVVIKLGHNPLMGIELNYKRSNGQF